METTTKNPAKFNFNHVNMIGKMATDPKVRLLPGGRKVANFSMTTKENYLNADGSMSIKQDWHRVTAFGRWATILEELCRKGVNIAVEGRLVSRFYKMETGERKMFSEIEVNDLIIL